MVLSAEATTSELAALPELALLNSISKKSLTGPCTVTTLLMELEIRSDPVIIADPLNGNAAPALPILAVVNILLVAVFKTNTLLVATVSTTLVN